MKGLVILVLLVAGCICHRRTTMKKRSTVYLPFSYSDAGDPYFTLGGNPVEQFTYDTVSKIAYVVGTTLLHAVSFSDPDNPAILGYKQFKKFELTDVVFCSGFLYTTYSYIQNMAEGGVIVMSDYPGGFDELYRIPVGVYPDSIEATSDCSTLVVAVEGVVYYEGNEYIDPPGYVAIVSFPGADGDYTLNMLDFTDFDDQVATLSASGVRQVYKDNGKPFSIDVEPEFVTISEDDKFAYVALQENNAVATVNIAARVILDVKGLGFKNMSTLKMDPSNEDGGVFLNSYNVLGMYQPDGITFLRRGLWGTPLLFMANEGQSKVYGGLHSEVRRGNAIDSSILPDNLDTTTADQLRRASLLGRLKFSVSDAGKDENGKLNALYMFGGRSFSVRRADDMSLVYDSGDDFERIVDYLKRDVFNTKMKCPSKNRPFENTDDRSDDKSFEPSSVAVREFGSLLLVAVLLERPGGIMLYSQAHPRAPFEFQDMYFGIPDTRGKTWQELFDERVLSEIYPEDVRMFGSDGPTKKPSMLVSGRLSGTLSLFDLDLWHGKSIRQALTCARYMPPFTCTDCGI